MESKKKRGRKPKSEEIEAELEDVPKKRGRKRKYDLNTNNDLKIHGFVDTQTSTIDVVKGQICFSKQSKKKGTTNPAQKINFGPHLLITKHEKKKVDTSDLHEQILKDKPHEDELKCEAADNEECEINLDVLTEPISKSQSKPMQIYDLLKKKTKKNKNSAIARDSETLNNYSKTTIGPIDQNPGVVVMLKHGKTTKEWPNQTNVLCWWCCHSFKTFPCFIPTRYDEIRKRYKVTGNFCSWNCAQSYYAQEFRQYRRGDMFMNMLKELQIPYSKIKNAPPKEVLQAFGGTLTIEDYRKFDQKIKLSRIMELDDQFRISNY
jgi:hypothetical protein